MKQSTNQLVFLEDALHMACYVLPVDHPTTLLPSIPYIPHVALMMSLRSDKEGNTIKVMESAE